MYQVLIADDEILDLEGMCQFIPWTDLGLEVTGTVNNGFEAMEVFENRHVDILVTDVHMPGMSGMELARKALHLHPDLKLIFVSGYQDFAYVKEALSLQAYSYVLKPMDDHELITVLQKITNELNEKHLCDEFDFAFSQAAIKSIEYHLIGKRSAHINEQHPDIYRMTADAKALILDKPLDRLVSCLLAGDRVMVLQEMEDLLSAVRNDNRKSQLHFIVLYLLIRIDNYVSTHLNYPVGFIPLSEMEVEQIKSHHSKSGLICWLAEHLLNLFDMDNHPRFKQKKHAKVIGQVIQYMEEHLHLNVTLREVADELSFSPNYLGAIFKEETGKSYNEYIIALRMEKARTLLQDPKIKVYEVADRVGYRYMPYFSRQFKETYGMTPIEYRRKA
ncbi:helix-turn-helix domain-containing protein [Paenibacillus sp. Marseille-Q4541]|uniref:response regulator transcription factor n=1 Tax=Paenibacillus sp. Marseille-Q4541 TaxID=2831522 RepID=UPI0020184956|nr:helix-turn-helix domain-containing protein [Paenibacillus sp. Marseille-Q4541]